jgi:hypothetical protein
MSIDELLTAIFDNQPHVLAPTVESWLKSSRRFRNFAEAYRGKIRKKLRGIRDPEGVRDLEFELFIAYQLLHDRRLSIEYEPTSADKQRGPDFAVTFTTKFTFNVEVTRLQMTDAEREDETVFAAKLSHMLIDKVGQMPPNAVNVIVASADAEPQEADVGKAAAALRLRAERKDEDYFMRRGFKDAADFLRQFQRLSAIVLMRANAPPSLVMWANSLSKHPLTGEVRGILGKLGEMGTGDA